MSLAHESLVTSHQSLDRNLIYGCAGLRALAVSLSGVIISFHLATLGYHPSSIGVLVSVGLAGCAAGTFLVTRMTDRFGRRASVVCIAWLMALGGLGMAWMTAFSMLFACAFLGMVNGMGRDRGPGLTVEQAMLPQTGRSSDRTTIFAWYNVVVDAGHAVGALLGALPAWLRGEWHMAALGSYRWTWIVYSVLCLAAGALALRLSAAVELRAGAPIVRLSHASRPLVVRFAALSALDSLGGGFLTSAFLGYWFFWRFGADEALLGPLFFAVRLANGASHLGAAWLARRIGLVNTMVLTHLPSSLLLMTVPFAPTLPIAIVMFLIRESLVEMDVPTRQSYLMAIVREEERTRAAGITNLTRGIGWAIAPSVAGWLMQGLSMSAPLVLGPGLKVAYDLLLYRAFRRVRPADEPMKGMRSEV